MTTPSTARKAGPLLGNGSTTSFPFTFKVFAAGDIAVTIADSLGVETLLALGADYSVTLNANQDTSPGGTVTYPITGSPLPAGSRLVILGDLDYDQPLDLPSGGNFNPLALENQLDRTVMQVQQLKEQVGRALQVSPTSGVDVTLPAPTANQLIGWDAGGSNLQNVPLSNIATALAFATYRYDTFTGDGSETQFTLSADPAVLGNLDVAVGGVTQTPNADYTLSGVTLVFTSAPPNGATVLARYGEALPQGALGNAADVAYTPAGVDAVPTTVEDKLRETVSVLDFGADPTGVDNSTAAIQRALNSTATEIIFPPGTYRVVDDLLNGSPVLTSAVANRKLHGPGIITATSQVKKLLLVTGDNSTVSLNIDGNLNIGYAVVVQAENPVVTGCNIWDLDGKTNYGGVAIVLDLDGRDTTALVSNNVIRNLQGAGDGVGGNGVGMQRAITINSNQNCTQPILVTGNHISQVEGEEGDALVVISSNGSGTYYTMPVVIDGNVIDLWTRRAVKVQAHGVTITGNTFSNDRAVNPGGLQRVIDIVQGGNAIIDGNRFKACKYQTQIGVNLSAPEAANNYAVTNNVIRGLTTETTSNLISLNTYGSGVIISGNSILCPTFADTAISATNCTEVLVSGNHITTNQAAWYSFTSSTNVRLAGNSVGNSLKPPYHFFYDLTANEFSLDVSNGRSLTLRQGDTELSDGEIAARIRCRQNDAGASEAINASVGFVAEGTSGALGVAIYTGSQATGTAETERVRITSSGVLRPAADNTQTIGSTTNRWSYVHALNVRTHGVTVAGLPTAATAGAGARAFVTDANATTFASIVADGGANRVPVYSDGTNWRIG